MTEKEITIHSLDEYFRTLIDASILSAPAQAHTIIKYVFRGEEKDYGNTKCLSSIGRHAINSKGNNIPENALLESWSLESEIADERKYPDSVWEKLMWGRHHNLMTRLTDWTTNPLTALWFACGDAYSGNAKDGWIYALYPMGICRSDFILSSPFLGSGDRYEVKTRSGDQTNDYSFENLFIIPPYNFHKRITRQSGVFHVAVDIEKSALDYSPETLAIKIVGENKKDIIADLSCCNVTAESLGLETPDKIAERLNETFKKACL